MHWSDLPLKPSNRMLRQFGVLLVVVFGSLLGWHRFHGDGFNISRAAQMVAVGAGVVGLVFPAILRPIFIASIVLTFPVGWAVSRVVLLLLFALAITPVALLFRRSGRDVLSLARNSGRPTYWTAKRGFRDASSYLRQF